MKPNDEFTMDVGLALDLKLAFRRNRWTEAQVKKLTKGDLLGQFLEVIEGRAKIEVTDYNVDAEVDPFVPNGWQVERHTKGGVVKFDKSKLALFLDEKQRGKGSIVGNELQKKLETQPILNANWLDFLLKHQHLIPESWKGKAVFFWGTIYRNQDGRLCVRYLYWYGVTWISDDSWLGHVFVSGYPAAVSSN